MRVPSINDEREKRNAPDADLVQINEGVKEYRFIVDYKDGDRRMSFHIWAPDLADAERQVKLIRENAEVIGQSLSEGFMPKNWVPSMEMLNKDDATP